MATTSMEAGILFDLRFRRARPLPRSVLQPLSAWRQLLYRVGLIGREPGSFGRYGGIGFGNLSCRLASELLPKASNPSPAIAPVQEGGPGEQCFVISGTGTSCLPEVNPSHWAVVRHCQPELNRVDAEGPVQPSSEALTHGAVYVARPEVGAVVHAHSRCIWERAQALELAQTGAEATYGTPDMAAAVAQLLAGLPTTTGNPADRVFAMGGHPDGVVAFGRDLEEASLALLAILGRAMLLAQE